MIEAPHHVEMPDVLPTGVTKRQWRLAALRPRVETAYAALIAAGYAETTALKQSSKTLERVGIQRAREAQALARLDSAGEIRAKSGAKVLREVSRDDTDPQFALAAWATAAKVQSEYPQEEAGVGDFDRNNAREYIQAIVDRVLLATGCTLDAMSTRQLVDAALLSDTASDNSQYVNSPPPAAGPLQIEAHAVPQKRKRRG